MIILLGLKINISYNCFITLRLIAVLASSLMLSIILTCHFMYNYLIPYQKYNANRILTITERVGRSQPVCYQEHKNYSPLHCTPQTCSPHDHFRNKR